MGVWGRLPQSHGADYGSTKKQVNCQTRDTRGLATPVSGVRSEGRIEGCGRIVPVEVGIPDAMRRRSRAREMQRIAESPSRLFSPLTVVSSLPLYIFSEGADSLRMAGGGRRPRVAPCCARM